MPDTGFFNPRELQQLVGIQEGMKVADFGSGSGEIAVIFARMVGPDGIVTAIDVLSSALESLEARAKHENLQNIHGVRADLEVPGSSHQQDASQAVAYLGNILWQSQKRSEILAEAVRVLKPGGVLAVVEWHDRIPKQELQELLAATGVREITNFPAGKYHYGLMGRT